MTLLIFRVTIKLFKFADPLIFRRRHVTHLVTGNAAHFDPMVQNSDQALNMMFDHKQPDLFDDPDFYAEDERQRIIKTFEKIAGS